MSKDTEPTTWTTGHGRQRTRYRTGVSEASGRKIPKASRTPHSHSERSRVSFVSSVGLHEGVQEFPYITNKPSKNRRTTPERNLPPPLRINGISNLDIKKIGINSTQHYLIKMLLMNKLPEKFHLTPSTPAPFPREAHNPNILKKQHKNDTLNNDCTLKKHETISPFRKTPPTSQR